MSIASNRAFEQKRALGSIYRDHSYIMLRPSWDLISLSFFLFLF